MIQGCVTLDEVFSAAAVRAASLVPETSGYLALAVGDAISRLPIAIDDRVMMLTTEGNVGITKRGEVLPQKQAAAGLRDLLARLLAVSTGSAMPALAAAGRPRVESDRGIDAVVSEIEAALIPVNRAAARRALARLARETIKAKEAGKVKPFASTRPPADPPKPAVEAPEPAVAEPAVVAPPRAIAAPKLEAPREHAQHVIAEATTPPLVEAAPRVAAPAPSAPAQIASAQSAFITAPPPSVSLRSAPLVVLPTPPPVPVYSATPTPPPVQAEPTPTALGMGAVEIDGLAPEVDITEHTDVDAVVAPRTPTPARAARWTPTPLPAQRMPTPAPAQRTPTPPPAQRTPSPAPTVIVVAKPSASRWTPTPAPTRQVAAAPALPMTPTPTFAPIETDAAPVEAEEALLEADLPPIQTSEVGIEATFPPIQASEVGIEATLPPIQASEVEIEASQAPVEVDEAPIEASQAPVEVDEAPVAIVAEPMVLAQPPVAFELTGRGGRPLAEPITPPFALDAEPAPRAMPATRPLVAEPRLGAVYAHHGPNVHTRADDLLAHFGASCMDDSGVRDAAACLRRMAGIEPTPPPARVELHAARLEVPVEIARNPEDAETPFLSARPHARRSRSLPSLGITLAVLFIGIAGGGALVRFRPDLFGVVGAGDRPAQPATTAPHEPVTAPPAITAEPRGAQAPTWLPSNAARAERGTSERAR